VELATLAVARPSGPDRVSAVWIEGASEVPVSPDVITLPVELSPPAVGTLSTYSFAPEFPGGMYGRSFAPAAAGNATTRTPAISNALIRDRYARRRR
jgi:hypothetical protein